MDVQETQDIIDDLVYCFKKYNDQAKPVSKKFSTGYIVTDAKNIYDFIKNNISYVAEPEKFQTTRSFSRIIHDKFGDCKHSALLASAIGWNLGYNVIFRFVSYDKGDAYGHVYTLIENPTTGKRVVIDPLQPFNQEKYFYKNVDYKAKNNLTFHPMLSRLTGLQPNVPTNSRVTYNNRAYVHPDETRVVVGAMEIIMSPSISGPEADTLDGLCGLGKRSKEQRKEHREQSKTARKETHAAKKEVRHEKRAAKKDVRAQKKEARGGSRVKKISLSPVRGAFSSLLLVNARGLATRLSQAITINEPEVKKFAAKLGYKYDNLKSQILKGGKKKPLLGSKIHGVVHDFDGIGLIVSAAAFTAAAPAILLSLELFKMLGIGGQGSELDTQFAQEATKDLTRGDTNISVDAGGSAPSSSDSGSADQNVRDIVNSRGGNEVTDIASGRGGENSSDTSGSGGGGGSATDTAFGDFMKSKTLGMPTPLLIIGAGGLLYFANKKFKIF